MSVSVNVNDADKTFERTVIQWLPDQKECSEEGRELGCYSYPSLSCLRKRCETPTAHWHPVDEIQHGFSHPLLAGLSECAICTFHRQPRPEWISTLGKLLCPDQVQALLTALLDW